MHKTMTNAQIAQKYAVEALEAGVLNDYEAEFVEEVRDYSKKELRNLSGKQYKLLDSISDKAPSLS